MAKTFDLSLDQRHGRRVFMLYDRQTGNVTLWKSKSRARGLASRIRKGLG